MAYADTPYTIESMELIEEEGKENHTGLVKGTMQGNVDVIYQVITDFEHFAEFMPRMKNVEILTKEPSFVKLAIEINMPFPISNMEYHNHIDLFPDQHRTEFRMIKGSSEDLKDFDGHWQLKAVKEDRTSFEYRVYSVSKTRYPGFVEKKQPRNHSKISSKMYKNVRCRSDLIPQHSANFG